MKISGPMPVGLSVVIEGRLFAAAESDARIAQPSRVVPIPTEPAEFLTPTFLALDFEVNNLLT